MSRVLLAASAALLTSLALAPAAFARDAIVRSFDGTEIVVHYFPAEGLKAGERAPTVLSGHGFGGEGETDASTPSSDAGTIGNGPLRKAGYNVLTWDARGFGNSQGSVEVDAPDKEARDVQALIDFVAAQPDALLDATGDPRVGMVGSSYGGGIQLTTAGIGEKRLDVLVPDIAWHSLVTSLYPEDTFLAGWGNALVAVGTSGLSPRGGGFDPHITSGASEGNASGKISDENKRWFGSRGPDELVENIRVPTFLTQGTVDTLFPLDEAVANFRILRSNGVPVKMLWHCGGHGACTTRGKNGPDPLHIEKAVLAWLKRHLDRDASVDTGPRFEWVSDDGVYRSAKDYPLAPQAPLVGTGAGTLPLKASPGTSGAAIAATPAAEAVNVAIPAPKAAAQVVGSPKLTLTYSGQGSSPETRVFAQITDTANNVVLGNLATPIPVLLDGKEHTLERSLESVAASLTPGSKLELQLTDSTSVFGAQRTSGAVTVKAARVALPVVDPAGTPAGPSDAAAGGGGGAGGGGQGSGGSANQGAKPGAVRVRIGFPRGKGSRRGVRRLRATLRTNRPITKVVVTLRNARGRTVGTGRVAKVGARRSLTLRLRRGLRPGRHRVTVRYAGGRTSRKVTFRR